MRVSVSGGIENELRYPDKAHRNLGELEPSLGIGSGGEVERDPAHDCPSIVQCDDLAF
jgi:hypothetical protein